MINIIRNKLLKNPNSKLSIEELNILYGLDCLKRIGGSAFFNNLEDSNGLTNLEEIGDYADFERLESAKGLENLKYIGGLINFKSLLTVDDLKKLEDRIILDMYIRIKNKIKSMKKVLVRK